MSAFQLLTHDPSASFAAVPKEIEQIQPKDDPRKFFEQKNKEKLDKLINELSGTYQKSEKVLEGMKKDLEEAKRLRQQIETEIQKLTRGTDESGLDEKTRNFIRDTRRDVESGIANGEKKVRDSEEKIKSLKNLLDQAIELRKKLDGLKLKR